MSEYFWRDAGIMKGRTQHAAMLNNKGLQCISEFGDSALPETTDSDGTIKGASKWMQIGADGYDKIIDAMLEGMQLDPRCAFVFVELNAGFGQMFDALVVKRQGWNFPSYYWSPTDDMTQHDWLMHTKKQNIKDMFLEGKLNIPGFTMQPPEMPTDLLENPPVIPSLNRLAVTKLKVAGSELEKDVLVMPDDIIKAYYSHPRLGARFKLFLEKFHEEWGAHQLPTVENNMQTPKKRPTDVADRTTGTKRPKIDDSNIVSEEMAGTQLLKYNLNVKIPGQASAPVSLTVVVGYGITITNGSAHEITLVAGTILMGFGKGKWQLQPTTKDGSPEDIQFELASSTTDVHQNNKLAPLAEVVKERRKTEPTCAVSYHDLTESPNGGVGDFEISPRVSVFFAPDPGQEKTMGAAASSIPTSTWADAVGCKVVWCTKWGCNGLTPVRPVVALTSDVILPAGRTFIVKHPDT